MAPGLHFHRGVHGVATADELMQSKREYRKASVRLLDAITDQKLRFDRPRRPVIVDTSQLG